MSVEDPTPAVAIEPGSAWAGAERPGLLIALLGVPVYVAFRAAAHRRADGLPD